MTWCTGGHRIPFIIMMGTLLATWCGGGGITGSAQRGVHRRPLGGSHHLCGAAHRHHPAVFHRRQGPQVQQGHGAGDHGARYGKAASIIAALCVMLAYVGVLATQLKAAADIIVLLCASSGIEISHGLALTSAQP